MQILNNVHPTLAGVSGVGLMQVMDTTGVTNPDTAGLILKLIVAIVSLIPTIKQIFSKKKDS